MEFVLAEDNTARVTKSDEESTATRSRDLAATLGGSLTGGSDVCKVRYVGAAGAGNAGYLTGFGLGVAGTPDVCFNPSGTNPGRTSLDFGGGTDVANAVTVQPDGKSLVVGYTPANANDFAIVRYNTDGTLDSSFGSGGIVTVDFAGHSDIGSSVVVQPDGKILVGGSAVSVAGNYDFALLRLGTNGALDTGFGGGSGKVTLDFSGGNDYSNAVMVQPDGKIVLAGYAFSGNDNFALARFNTDGTLDTATFGVGTGKATLDFAGGTDDGLAAVLQQDGKIVLAGYTVAASNTNFALSRFNSDGTLDSTFGTAGKTTLDFAGGTDIVTAAALQPDGKIVVAGYATESVGGRNIALARYTTSGSLDSSFNASGKVTLDFAAGTDEGYGVALQSDGKIIVAGSAVESVAAGGKNMAVARFTSSGTLDATFGSSGKSTLDLAADADVAFGVALQGNGEIVAVGSTGSGIASNFALARFHP